MNRGIDFVFEKNLIYTSRFVLIKDFYHNSTDAIFRVTRIWGEVTGIWYWIGFFAIFRLLTWIYSILHTSSIDYSQWSRLTLCEKSFVQMNEWIFKKEHFVLKFYHKIHYSLHSTSLVARFVNQYLICKYFIYSEVECVLWNEMSDLNWCVIYQILTKIASSILRKQPLFNILKIWLPKIGNSIDIRKI